VHDQRDAHRFKAAARQLRAVRGCGGRHRLAVHVRKVNASLLKDTAIAQHPAASAAAAFPLPAIFDEFAAVNGAELLADSILELEKESFYLVRIGSH
jgi:hypothetical protein